MKKIFLICLLISSITCNYSITCFSVNDFDYGVNKIDSFRDTCIVEDNNKQTSELTAFDTVPLFNRSITVPAKKNISALIRSFCNMCSGGYDLARVVLETYCGNDSTYSLTIKNENELFDISSTNGEILLSVPEGEFSAHIKNNDDKDLSCITYLMGVGMDTTPEEGFNLNLTCYDKDESGKKVNMWTWLAPLISVVGASALVGGIGGVHKHLQGDENDVIDSAQA